MPPAALLSLATATPPHTLLQDDVLAFSRTLFADRYREFERLAPVFANAGIRQRQAVRPMDWYAQERGWPQRTAAYLEAADALFVDCAQRALAEAGLTAAAVDTVVTVSSTGIATPSLEARVFGRMGFRSDVARVPVFGLGCAGGVSGLSLAARLAVAEPGSVVLLVTVELCTLAFRLDELTPANMVATALFGDGAAACVLSAGPRGLGTVEAFGEHTWPDTLDIMGWNVDPLGFGVIFARAIPPFATEHLGPAIRGILARQGLSSADVDRYVCHPGGAKVIAALEETLALPMGALDHERAVLADHGNMSAPTVLFVLKRLLAAKTSGRMLLTSLGPGFTASCLSLILP